MIVSQDSQNRESVRSNSRCAIVTFIDDSFDSIFTVRVGNRILNFEISSSAKQRNNNQKRRGSFLATKRQTKLKRQNKIAHRRFLVKFSTTDKAKASIVKFV